MIRALWAVMGAIACGLLATDLLAIPPRSGAALCHAMMLVVAVACLASGRPWGRE